MADSGKTLGARYKECGAFGILSSRGKGDAAIQGDTLVLRRDDGDAKVLPFVELESFSFSSINGLWLIRPKTGRKVKLQTTGQLFSVGDRAAGRAFNEELLHQLARYNVKGLVA